MLASSQRDQRSLGALLHELVGDSSRLLRQEWRLATLQLRDLAAQLGKGTVQIAASGVFFALGSIALIVGAVLALADPWVRLHITLVIAAAVILLVAVVVYLARHGIGTLMQAEFADDNNTEVSQWQHQRRKFAATSR